MNRVCDSTARFSVDRAAAEEQPIEDRPDHQFVDEAHIRGGADVAVGDASFDPGPELFASRLDDLSR